MDEHVAFETRAVLTPRRARRMRWALLVPVVALVAIAWVGVSGNRPAIEAAVVPDSTPASVAATAVATIVPQPEFPAEVLGLDVRRLGDVQLAALTREDIVVIAGWYVPLAITDCPAVTPDYDDASVEIRPGRDPWAFCERSGVLHDSRPDKVGSSRRIGPDAEDGGIGPSSVDASLVIGVKLPRPLERVGADPMPIVVLGHFVETSDACMLIGMCPSELIVDYVAWTPSS